MDNTRDPSPNTSAGTAIRDTIQSGNTVLLRLPNGDIRSVKLDKDSCDQLSMLSLEILTHIPRTITIGRLGSFFANELIDEPYGITYELLDKKLKVVPPRTLQEVGRKSAANAKHRILIK